MALVYEDYVVVRPYLSGFNLFLIGKEDQSCFYPKLTNDKFREKAAELIGSWQCTDYSIGEIRCHLEDEGYFVTNRDDKEAFQAAHREFEKVLHKKVAQFHLDLATELGVADHPKFRDLAELIWEQIRVDYSFATADLLKQFAELYTKFSVILRP